VTKPLPGKLKSNCPDFPSRCDVCNKQRSQGKHYKCSRIRQERHAQALRNEEFDRLLMFDKKESDDDPPIPIQRTHADAHQ